MEPGSRTSALWLRWIPRITLCLDGRRQTQFRSQQDWERSVALHPFYTQQQVERSKTAMGPLLQRAHVVAHSLLALLPSPMVKLAWKICARC